MILGFLVLLGRLNTVKLGHSAQWVIGVWGVVVLIFSVFVVPMGWQRYYIPFFPVLGWTVSLGIIWFVQLFLRDAKSHSLQFKKGSVRVASTD